MIDTWWFRFKTFLNQSFFTNKKGRVKRYGVPILFALLVIVAKSVVTLVSNEDFSFHLVFLAVIFCAWYGGFGPGIFATIIIGVLNDYLFTQPRFQFDYHSLTSISIFFIEGLLVSIIAEAKRQSDLQKDEFIGFASHELKNPLASIKGFALLIQKSLTQTKEKQLSYMATKIEEQADRATMLIDELLDITKIDANKLELSRTTFVVYDFVKDTIKEEQLLSPTHKILLSAKTKKKIYADKYRLKQVLINLLSNAIKYSPKANKIKVTIEGAKKEIIIAVQDFGIGIENHQIEKVFDRFYRTDTAQKKNIQGLGLGLYITSQIIKRHDGRIWVDSKKGKGSTFCIALPAA